MTHPLWMLISRADTAIEMLKMPLMGETPEAVRSSASMIHGQVENALSSFKAELLKFIQDDEHKTAVAAATAALPMPAPLSLPSLPSTQKKGAAALAAEDDDGDVKLTQVEQLAKQILVSLLARTIPIESPADHAMAQAEGFFKMLAAREHVR